MPAAPAKPALEPYQVVPGQTETRQHIFSVLVKRTYAIRAGALVRLERPRPFVLTDLYFKPGDPEICSVLAESDLVPYKLATDVIVTGSVHAPKGAQAQAVDAGIDVAGSRSIVRAYGDRQCLHRHGAAPAFTEPIPFRSLELRYERSYGGSDSRSIPDMPFAYPRNHLGRGFVLNNDAALVHGLPLPNFEDPADPLTPDRVIVGEPAGWARQPLPHGLGWFQKTWYPRCSFAGAMPAFLDPDTVLREMQLGLVPPNQVVLAKQLKLPSFDTRFNNGASRGLTVPYLQGGERVRLLHLSAEGSMEFHVTAERPAVAIDIGLGGPRQPVMFMHSMSIRCDENEVDFVWRASHEHPGIDWLPEMKKLEIEVLPS